MDALNFLTGLLKNRARQVEDWLEKRWGSTVPLPYFSCDIRHADFKLAVVDTNLFPGGFNNLCNAFTRETQKAFMTYFDTYYPQAKSIALLAETHTRNKFYLLNILKLQNLINASGRKCFITMVLPDIKEATTKITLSNDEKLEIHLPQLDPNRRLNLAGEIIDLILSNNDFSLGVPHPFNETTTPIIPHPSLGWQQRLKSRHFEILESLTRSFVNDFGAGDSPLDPWLFSPLTQRIANVSESNLSDLSQAVGSMLSSLREKYQTHHITEQPHIFIKNDSGTYGLGVTSVFSAEEVLNLNRKKRQKLFAAKNGGQNRDFIIQEGIPTHDSYSEFPIEPVIYGVGKVPVGGFFRIHETKTAYESLNSPGMSFSCLCLHKLDEPHEAPFICCQSKEDVVLGSRFLARLASLAAALEHV